MATTIDLGQWLSTMYADYTAGRAEKRGAFEEGVGALKSYADIFRPGGEYGAGVEAMIGRGEKKAVASGMQSLVSAGLAGTTMPMHLTQTYEEEVGMPTRLRAEDVRMERLGGALGSLGQMYAQYDPMAPTGGDIAHMATGGFGAMTSRGAAEAQALLAKRALTAANQARLPSQQMFGGGAGAGGGGGGDTGGVGTGTSLHRGGFASPYDGGIRGGEYGYEEPQVMVGGQRVIPGTEIPWQEPGREDPFDPRMTDLQADLAAGRHRAGETPQQTYDARMAMLRRTPEGGDLTMPSRASFL